MNKMRVIFLAVVFIMSSLNCYINGEDGFLQKVNINKDKNISQYGASLEKLRTRFGLGADNLAILINVADQKLYLIQGEQTIKTYPISTAINGVGSEKGSSKTPLGTHSIVDKKGKDAKTGAIFQARINSGKIAKIYTETPEIKKKTSDFVTTRILRLTGLEEGVNKGEGIDSYKRCIYIHGTPDEYLIGTPASHGCIRMKNKDVVELFNIVPLNTLVEIIK